MEKRVQLFCLPFAGGSKVLFKQLKRSHDPKIDVCTIEYSGPWNVNK